MSALCGGSGEWARIMAVCPFCKARRRGLVALVFGGYGANAICGGCGSFFSDGEGRWGTSARANDEREERLAFVRGRWPEARHHRVVLREVLQEVKP